MVDKKSIDSINELFNGTQYNLLNLIKKKYILVKKAQKILNTFNNSYLSKMKVCYFNEKKLILETNNPEFFSKFREIKQENINFLQQNKHFKNIEKIDIILNLSN